MSDKILLPESWKKVLLPEFSKPYFLSLKSFLQSERQQGKIVYPPSNQIFACFDATPIEEVKVVILGQDPYHGAEQAHGLCFSVNEGVAIPPSLQNIFKEQQVDVGKSISKSGNLHHWAKQGVLLLNTTLTVRQNEAGSHQKKGWEQFTDKVIETVSAHRPHVVFILWGKFAQSKISLIDASKHCILTAAHPSPLSAHNGFFGCKHFSKTNAFLQSHGMEPIYW